MRGKISFLFVIYIVALCMANAANAGSETYTESFDVEGLAGTDTVLFPKFDTHGGTRVLDEQDLYSDVTFSGHITIESEGAAHTYDDIQWVVLGGAKVIGGTGLGGLSLIKSLGPVSLDANDSVPESGSDFHDFGVVTQFLSFGGSAPLNQFVGTGTVSVQFSIRDEYFDGGLGTPGGSPPITLTDFSMSGLATIYYHYSAPTPPNAPVTSPVSPAENPTVTISPLSGPTGAITATLSSTTTDGDLSAAYNTIDPNDAVALASVNAGAVSFAIPAGLSGMQVWNIDFTGALNGPVTLVFNYSDAGLTLAEEQALTIEHFVNGRWVDLHGIVDTNANLITISTDSFSPFALGEETAIPEPASLALLGAGAMLLLHRRRRSD